MTALMGITDRGKVSELREAALSIMRLCEELGVPYDDEYHIELGLKYMIEDCEYALGIKPLLGEDD